MLAETFSASQMIYDFQSALFPPMAKLITDNKLLEVRKTGPIIRLTV